jgi:thymidylate synthase (FAD)
MQFKEPVVILLAETMVNRRGVQELRSELGAPDWATDAASCGEELVEVAGRLCYKSFAPGLNPNVTKVRGGNREYVQNILKSKHGSVLEHATVTFAFLNVSRVFTHEIVRHRAGTAFSQESLRYVRLTNLSAFLPHEFDEEDRQMMADVFNAAEDVQNELARKYRLDDTKNFGLKKRLTSAFRRLVPIGLSTNIIVTANHRAWRHIIEQRANAYAEEEIERVMRKVAKVLKVNFPALYQDMEFGEREVRFDNSKV